MKKVLYILLAAIGLIVTTSCEREKLIYDLGEGSVDGITGTLDLTAFDAVPNDDVIDQDNEDKATRAVDTRNFMVEIYKVNGVEETLEHRWQYAETPEIVVLVIGDYKLKVYSHEVQVAGWEEPYYYAEETFSIEENKVTSIEDIICTLQNIKVTVAYTADLKAVMGENCQVTIAVGQGELTYDKEEKRAGYFRADSENNQLIAVFTGDIEGREEVSRIQVSNVKAGEWRKITYDIKRSEPGNENGTITPSISIDASCDIVNVDREVPVEEDVIVDPNPIEPPTPPTPPTPGPGGDGGNGDEDKELPQVTSEFIQLGVPVVITDGLQVVVDITSSDPNGLTALTVDIESPTLTPEELEAMGLASHLDLVNPGSLKDAIEGLGFPTEGNVLNQSKVTFDITEFMPLLSILGSATHNFHITATDALGTTHETLILVIQ